MAICKGSFLMIRLLIPPNFDVTKFSLKFGVTNFHSDGTHLVSEEISDLTEADIADCVVDLEKLSRITARQEGSKENARAIPGWASFDDLQAVDYITNNVNDLDSAKAVLIKMARMIVALRDNAFPDIQE